MSDFRFISLFSGSSGNCEYIKYNDTEILIDAGKSLARIKKELNAVGSDISNISAIFITHEHSDHTNALKTLLKNHSIPVHMTIASCGNMNLCSPNIVLHEAIFEEKVGQIEVSSFEVPHDSACAVGYKIKAGPHTIGVATDMGELRIEILKTLLGCESVVIESNYDEKMLINGPYTQLLKERIAGKGGHLSNTECAHLAAALAIGGTSTIALGHLSENNNLPEKALERTYEAMKKNKASAKVLVLAREEFTVISEE